MDNAFAQTTSQTGVPASAAGAHPAAAQGPLGNFSFFVPFLAIVGLFYFLMIYPQKKEQQKREETLKAIQRGDRVLTRGGLYGTVADIKEQVLTLKINESQKVEIHRDYVETVQKPS